MPSGWTMCSTPFKAKYAVRSAGQAAVPLGVGRGSGGQCVWVVKFATTDFPTPPPPLPLLMPGLRRGHHGGL